MGDHYPSQDFVEEDFQEFKQTLRKETATLMKWFQDGTFKSQERTFGLELETWLVGEQGQPLADNEAVLKRLKDPMIVPELSQFNLEINAKPKTLEGKSLHLMHEELREILERANRSLQPLGQRMIHMGSLPLLHHQQLDKSTISDEPRYRHLNHQIMKLKKGRPSQVKIKGDDYVNIRHHDVMMEAAATSLQIHLQVPIHEIGDFYNASLLGSSIMVALSANTPFVFGKSLWAESRIPLFEQALSLPCFYDIHGKMIERVTFGSGFVRQSLMECFLENLDGFPILLPIAFEPSNLLDHLRLHNGTIWRWNRPILGVDSQGIPAMRIEHRCPAASPSLSDLIADTAFYLGLVHYLVTRGDFDRIAFAKVRRDFYHSAEQGLEAEVHWPGIQGKLAIRQLLLDNLIPEAKKALLELGIAKEDVEFYLDDVLVHRVETGQNGCVWQRKVRQGRDASFEDLVQAYADFQNRDIPVSRWTI